MIGLFLFYGISSCQETFGRKRNTRTTSFVFYFSLGGAVVDPERFLRLSSPLLFKLPPFRQIFSRVGFEFANEGAEFRRA